MKDTPTNTPAPSAGGHRERPAWLSSFTTTLVLLALYAAGLAAATLIEKYRGTPAALAAVYHAPLFLALQALLVANFVAAAIRHHLWRRRPGLVLTHGALIVILTGALVTHLTGLEGVLHLREGETSNRIILSTKDGPRPHTLPFSVRLTRFTLGRYPGSASPSSYESEVVISDGGTERAERIYMNNVLDVRGYRFFQSSYDPDERGTILSVSRDVTGRRITYTGYALLALGLLLSLLGPHTRFRRLAGMLGREATALPLLLLLLLPGIPLSARPVEPKGEAWQTALRYTVPADEAGRFAALPMQSAGGRLMPVGTFASEILRKLHKADRIGPMNAEQFLVSLLVMPDVWRRIPCIAMTNADIAALYGLPKGAVAYADAFDKDGNYKLQRPLEQAYSRAPAERSRFDKDLMKLDEQLNIFHQLLGGRMLRLFPRAGDPGHTWLAAGDDLKGLAGEDSLFVATALGAYLDKAEAALKGGPWAEADRMIDEIESFQRENSTLDINAKKISAELLYNRLGVFRTCRVGYLVAGGLLLALAFARLFRRGRWTGIGAGVLVAVIACTFLYHLFGIALRWHIGGYAPWSNSYETMVYVALCTAAAGLLFARRSLLTLAVATLFGGVILFVSGLSWLDPHINPLVPVLKSPWLMFHVAVVTAAYGFFGIGFLLGIVNLTLMSITKKGNAAVLRGHITQLSVAGEMALWAGLALMTAGTFLGAVWANESWGRYWGWDPKETWALITMVTYAAVTHLHLTKWSKDLWLFNLCSVLAFTTVLMTFFGVNYFLSGMHAYGHSDVSSTLFIIIGAVFLAIAGLAVVARGKWQTTEESLT